MNITPTQQRVLDAVHKHDKLSCTELAPILKMTPDNAGRHLRYLAQMGYIYVAEQDANKHRKPINLYSCGSGYDAQKKAAQLKQNAARKSFTKRNTYDPDAPLAPNNGWVSQIYSWDRTVSQLEHVEFMKRFQPHPDRASEWLFNEPKVELLGAKHD